MNYERCIAGIFIGAGSLFFIYKGEYATAAGLLGGMVGFFVGEKNGQRQTASNKA